MSPNIIRPLAAATLLALASLANAAEGAPGVNQPVKPVAPKVEASNDPQPLSAAKTLSLFGSFSKKSLTFKTAEKVNVTVDGDTKGSCGLLLTVDGSAGPQPVAFVVNANTPFKQTRQFEKLVKGTHTATATPVPGPNGIPPCYGEPISTTFQVQ